MTKKDARAAALTALVDELGDLEAELQPWRKKLSRLEAVRAALRAAFASAAGDKTYSAVGDRYEVLVGLPGSVSVVDRLALLRLIGPKKFASIASVSIKSLEAACGANVAGAVVTLEPAGPRSLTIVARAADEVA